MPNPPKLGTLADLIRQRRQLWLTCWPCRRHVRVDIAATIARQGDLSLQSFLLRSRCGQCGCREIDCTAPPEVGSAGAFGYLANAGGGPSDPP